MTYTARYMHRRHVEPEYFRTIYADSVNEASRMAERYTKKDYIMVTFTHP